MAPLEAGSPWSLLCMVPWAGDPPCTDPCMGGSTPCTEPWRCFWETCSMVPWPATGADESSLFPRAIDLPHLRLNVEACLGGRTATLFSLLGLWEGKS